MFDTHSHLNAKEFENNFTAAINSARDVGVEKILIPGTDIEDSKKAVMIAEQFEGVYASAGVHPTLDFSKTDIDKLESQIRDISESSEKVVAIGETGLDLYRYKSAPNIQIKIFRVHYKLAKMLGLALIIHNRHATDEILREVEDFWDESMKDRVVFHCAEANNKITDFAVANSCYIGVDGDVTYDKRKQEFIRSVPLNRLVLETDSPVLIPEPLKSSKVFPNEPQYIKITAEFVAKLKHIKEDELIKYTFDNSVKLYGIL